MSATPQADKPQRKMQECNKCKAAGFPNQPIAFEKMGEDPATGKIKWKLIDENGNEHVHKGAQRQNNRGPKYRVAELIEAKGVKEANALLMGNKMIDYMGHYYDAISNSVIYVLARKEAMGQ